MDIVFLGTGSAIPIPRHLPDGSRHECPQCRSSDPRDQRWPSALLIDKNILIDAPPNVLELLHSVHVNPTKIHSVILTHRHSDALSGLRSLPKGISQVFPSTTGSFEVHGYYFEAVKVPHDARTWGYLIDETLAYFSDYSDITPALAALGRAKVAVLDGSGWGSAFPTHQPMVQAIPVVKRLTNLENIYFTHVGHTQMTHQTLERKTKNLGDSRFSIAYHALQLNI